MRHCYALVLALLLGCGSAATPMPLEDPNRLPELRIDPAPLRGMQMIMPIVRAVPPGADLELCTWTDKILDTDLDVESISASQAGPGHHVIIYTTSFHQPPGTSRPCLDTDMITFHYVVGVGGEGTGYINKPPAGLSFYMPKGSQLVVNEHFLNASAKPHDGQSAFTLSYADPAKQYIRSSNVVMLDLSMVAAPGRSSLDVHTTIQEDAAAWRLFPHMHQWGTHVLVEQEHEGVTRRLFDLDWSPGYVFQPPELTGTVEAPLWLRKGDRVHLRCDWNNTTGEPLSFGKEMCLVNADVIDFDRRGSFVYDKNELRPF